MKETEEKQDVKKQVSDQIRPLHRLTQVQMQLSEPSACLSCLLYKIVMLIISIYPNSFKDSGNMF